MTETTNDFTYTAQGSTNGATLFRHPAPRGRILLMPDWEGMNSQWARAIARRYALTCCAEVILTDHYGLHCPHPSFDEAARINQALYRTPAATRELFRQIVTALQPHWTSEGPLIVIGFCSGGTFAFETGRSGAAVDAVFCIHGDPGTRAPFTPGPQSPIFTMVHGGLDPFITDAALNDFRNEMQEYKCRWALHIISGAKHSFSRFDNNRQNYGIGYSARAEIESRHLVQAQIASLLELIQVQ